ncbi:hypothetical protein GUJ93_ZPchr0007g3555 [Zizania palustris]|uniref:Autophagy-related protein n=1 Tax=Zizania palustris TaxID=103762 RepID=A0A8J5TC18_ZIZPA|nr:hypothetical protein GUJ93_ZPchr0007g3555 [Zizania palustris]
MAERRQTEASHIREKYPDRIHVIVEEAERRDVPDIDKKKPIFHRSYTGYDSNHCTLRGEVKTCNFSFRWLSASKPDIIKVIDSQRPDIAATTVM